MLPLSKKQRVSTTASHARTATASIAASTSATFCAIIVGSTTDVLQKKLAHGTKCQAKDLKSDTSDSDNDMVSNLCYKGLGNDEDDTLERALAVSSSVKALVAAQMNKMSPQ
jgi:hypothetical protein